MRLISVLDANALSSQKTLLHEFGHLYGAPDHYTQAVTEDMIGEGYSDYCIYGSYKDVSDVVNDLTICDGCRMKIIQNVYKYNYQ